MNNSSERKGSGERSLQRSVTDSSIVCRHESKLFCPPNGCILIHRSKNQKILHVYSNLDPLFVHTSFEQKPFLSAGILLNSMHSFLYFIFPFVCTNVYKNVKDCYCRFINIVFEDIVFDDILFMVCQIYTISIDPKVQKYVIRRAPKTSIKPVLGNIITLQYEKLTDQAINGNTFH